MEAVWHFSAIATDKDNGEAFGTHVTPPPPKHSSLVEEVEVSVSGDTIVSDSEVATDTASSIGFTRGNVQIVTGDFNAEPHEPAYRFITGQLPPVVDPVPEGVEGSMPSQCHPDFQDAWVVGGDEESESDGYTFPSCNPVKRIDFILVRNSSSTKCFKSTDNGDWKATIEHTRRVGLEPTTETADRVGVSAVYFCMLLIVIMLIQLLYACDIRYAGTGGPRHARPRFAHLGFRSFCPGDGFAALSARLVGMFI